MSKIKIKVNGKDIEVTEGIVVDGLLEGLDISKKGIAVELNGEIVPKGRYAATLLMDGDAVEIIHMVGGG